MAKKEKANSELVAAVVLADVFNLTPRRLQQLVKEGLPKATKNKYPLIACTKWYVRFLQNALEKKGAPMGDGSYTLFREEKGRTMRVTAELKELELAERRGLLVTVEDSKHAMEQIVHMLKARLRALPPRLAAELTGENSKIMIQSITATRIDEALALTADDANANTLDRPLETPESISGSGAIVPTA